MNAIAKTGGALAVERVSQDALAVIKHSLYPGAADDSVAMVLSYCAARGLDPMLKPVHIVPVWDQKSGSMRDVVMPGIPLYRIQAARTGNYAGKSEPEYGPDVTEKLGARSVTYPSWCRVTVRRIIAGQVFEFTAKEYWKENYATKKRDTDEPNTMWAKRPYGQLAKCTEAQALRMAFPEETGGEPTAEEMEGKVLPPDAMPAARGPTIDGNVRPTQAGGLLEHVQQQRTQGLPLIDSQGTTRAVSPGKWLEKASEVLGKLDSYERVEQWSTAMREHQPAVPADLWEQMMSAVVDRADALAAVESTGGSDGE